MQMRQSRREASTAQQQQQRSGSSLRLRSTLHFSTSKLFCLVLQINNQLSDLILQGLGLPHLTLLLEVELADRVLGGHPNFLVEVDAHKHGQPVRIEVGIGEAPSQ